MSGPKALDVTAVSFNVSVSHSLSFSLSLPLRLPHSLTRITLDCTEPHHLIQTSH